ncbi:hypothetical protein [Pseudomaricurvus sp. HS19]|uniref:hypothetical protein n=1 Tax=Pseudomaricurvus sp. HS19 TaxID=2692626 RepID=UPI00136F0B6E|nr:hypothetical protein [Pseudomaricurvus sp. HS19]MYM63365.1 hypothetical protein [Pseudomaricurvus sp. HS19]
MSEQAQAGQPRVVITTDSERISDAVLEYALAMAARQQLPVVGLLIEDTDLLNSSTLPFSREICLFTGQPRLLDTRTLLAGFSDMSRRLRQRLAQRADPLALHWSVSSIRGRRRDFHFEHLGEADYCIYDSCVYGSNQPPHHEVRTGKHLLVIDGAGAAFYNNLTALLAPFSGQALQVTLVHTSDLGQEPPLAELLPAGTRLHHLSRQQLPQALQQAGQRFDYVVVSRRHWLAELAPQLAQLNCPLIVVG